MTLRKGGEDRTVRSSTESMYIDIIQAYCNGKTMKEISASRFLNYDTVRSAFLVMRTKYNANTTAELIATLFRKNLLK